MGMLEDDLLVVMGVDTLGVTAPYNMFGFRNENWREFKLPWGQVALVPKDFQTEVLRQCALLSPGGGFVFNAVHNVQANTPVRNIAAMMDAVKAFNGRG